MDDFNDLVAEATAALANHKMDGTFTDDQLNHYGLIVLLGGEIVNLRGRIARIEGRL